jgi:hypothetical protein
LYLRAERVNDDMAVVGSWFRIDCRVEMEEGKHGESRL